jgi:beta-glucanase (GH16 family)
MPNRLIKIMAFVIGLFPFAAFLAAGDAVDPATAGAVPSVPEITSQGYKLAFSDEFNGTKLDEEKWVYRVDSKGLSTELPANATVSDGLLHLAVKKESAKGKAYTGGGIISKAEFQYGYYLRARAGILPFGPCTTTGGTRIPRKGRRRSTSANKIRGSPTQAMPLA